MIPPIHVTSGAVDLTKAIRSFQTPQVAPTRKRSERGLYFGSPTYVPPSTSDGEVPGVLKWSASQPVQTTTLEAMGYTINWPDDENNEYAETMRQTRTERIEQEGNPENWVDVEVVEYIRYKNGQNKPSSYQLNN